MSTIRKFLPIIFLFSGIAFLWAQVIPDGKTISSITIELDGPDTIGEVFHSSKSAD